MKKLFIFLSAAMVMNSCFLDSEKEETTASHSSMAQMSSSAMDHNHQTSSSSMDHAQHMSSMDHQHDMSSTGEMMMNQDTTWSESGMYYVVITEETLERLVATEVKAKIYDQHHMALAGLDLEVTLWMPAHNHGSDPVMVMEHEEGMYHLSNVIYTMLGHWTMTFNLKGKNDEIVVDRHL